MCCLDIVGQDTQAKNSNVVCDCGLTNMELVKVIGAGMLCAGYYVAGMQFALSTLQHLIVAQSSSTTYYTTTTIDFGR